MPAYSIDVDAVTALIRRVSDDIIMPKFHTLRADEIYHKPTTGHVDDIVTTVDRDVERQLASGLIELLPTASVLGEEAAHADITLLDLLIGDRPVWVVDPLDGTANFAAGRDGFGTMVGLVTKGRVRHAWVHLPARSELFTAEAGGGAYYNGERLVVPAVQTSPPRVALFLRYMPPEVRSRVLTSTAQRIAPGDHTGAAAVEYTDIARGRKELAIYYRLLPWDHGAPALILSESGGAVEHLDGSAYTIRSAHQITLVARDRNMAARARAWLTEEPE